MTALACTKCSTPLTSSVINLAEPVPCPGCQTPLRAEVFPALFREVPRGSAGELALQEGQATCFYHPQKTAHVPCDACGRFICALCDVELHGEHLCPACIESGRRKGNIVTLENKRTLHDSIALTLALAPALMWPVTVITAPGTIVYALMTWKKPGSLVRRSKARFIVALIIASLTVVAWGFLAFKIATSFERT